MRRNRRANKRRGKEMIKVVMAFGLAAVLSTRSYSSHSYRTPRATTPRLYYGGGKHTASHGGKYAGGASGASHKGGHYVNPRTANHYGKHK